MCPVCNPYCTCVCMYLWNVCVVCALINYVSLWTCVQLRPMRYVFGHFLSHPASILSSATGFGLPRFCFGCGAMPLYTKTCNLLYFLRRRLHVPHLGVPDIYLATNTLCCAQFMYFHYSFCNNTAVRHIVLLTTFP